MKKITFFKIDSRSGRLLESLTFDATIASRKQLKGTALRWGKMDVVPYRFKDIDENYFQIDAPGIFATLEVHITEPGEPLPAYTEPEIDYDELFAAEREQQRPIYKNSDIARELPKTAPAKGERPLSSRNPQNPKMKALAQNNLEALRTKYLDLADLINSLEYALKGTRFEICARKINDRANTSRKAIERIEAKINETVAEVIAADKKRVPRKSSSAAEIKRNDERARKLAEKSRIKGERQKERKIAAIAADNFSDLL